MVGVDMSTLEEEITRLRREGWELEDETDTTAELSRGDEVIDLEADLWGEVKIRNSLGVSTDTEDPYQISDSNYEIEDQVDTTEVGSGQSRPKFRMGRGWIISAAILIYLIVSYFLRGD